jgi:hypothetical protein
MTIKFLLDSTALEYYNKNIKAQRGQHGVSSRIVFQSEFHHSFAVRKRAKHSNAIVLLAQVCLAFYLWSLDKRELLQPE